MLKLVVSDLDGTLINGQNELSFEIFSMLDKLKQNNIMFAVASGRKICELKKLFSKVKDDIIFIACDGAYVTYKDKVLLKEVIDPKMLDKLNISCEKLSDSFGDTVKIIVKSGNLTERMAEYIKINRLLSCVYNDFGIKEYVKYSVNKGTALKKVLELFNIDKNDVVVFADNYNDIQMLKLIPNSYATEGAKPEIKQICRYRTKSVCMTVTELIDKTTEVRL